MVLHQYKGTRAVPSCNLSLLAAAARLLRDSQPAAAPGNPTAAAQLPLVGVAPPLDCCYPPLPVVTVLLALLAAGLPELLASRLLPEQVEQDAAWRAALLPGGNIAPQNVNELFHKVEQQVWAAGLAAAGQINIAIVFNRTT
jgi:hypothetical protein